MKNKKDNKNKKIKITIAVILIFISLFMIFTSFETVSNNKQNKSYNIKNNINHKIYLKDNDFFGTEYLEDDKAYVSALTNHISLDFNYSLTTSRKQNMKSKYNIIATIYVDTANTNENLWKKDFILIEDQELFLEDVTKGKIEQTVYVDFNLYNNMVKKFKENLNTPITAYLKVSLNTNPMFNIESKDESEEQIPVSQVTINLNEDIYKLSKKVNDTNSNTLSQDSEQESKVNKVQLLVGISIFVIAAVVVMNNTKDYMKFDTRSEYSITISKILKNYGDIVAEIVHPVNLDNMKIIDVKNFDQLLDVEEELRMPILFYEITRGEEGCFIIIHNDIAYRYILRNKKKKRGIF